MLAAIRKWFDPSPVRQQAYGVYLQVVEQSRKPFFYAQWQVPDTLDGRFDIIVLHLSMVISRLGKEEGQEFSRLMCEAFFADMDRSLREMGSTDTGVSIRIKNMAQAFYGRLKAYEDAGGDEEALKQALARNIFRDREVSAQALASLAGYVQRNGETLLSQTLTSLLQGVITFSD